ncbi:MAG TPA: DNA mismatch repair protein MutS [Acetobacteraceae bacterium]|nr:DNA mismatch repair protein MutS [Acetobacteraceae bacterium]HUN86838.1 hypothetical protein [Terracidiphilus sp.]
MTFYSILFPAPADDTAATGEHWVDYAHDLNLDQVVQKISGRREEYQLATLFERPLRTKVAIQYRHEVVRDLEVRTVHDCIVRFAEQMQRMRGQNERVNKLYYLQQKQRWFVQLVATYCQAIKTLLAGLDDATFASTGLCLLHAYLQSYLNSEWFRTLETELVGLLAELDRVPYAILIKNDSFKVQRYESESDYSAEVSGVFAKFRQGDTKDYLVEFRDTPDMNHIEAKVLEFVALLHPDVFARLARFCSTYENYLDPPLARFDREVQFYLGYLDFIAPIKRAGLPFCYPEVMPDIKQVSNIDGFDLALAAKLVTAHASVVCNSFSLDGKERVFVVSGPNQGGKTTFARVFGQLHHLASLGLPVPGREAHLFLPDAIYTHFEREEDITTLHGKLEDDLVRMHAILQQLTSDSILIVNEIFNSTTLQDAVFLASRMMEQIVASDCLCVCVTFLDELASFSDTIVSMMSTVDQADATVRTYKVVRRTADGRAYAISLAEKYRLTFEQLRARIPAPLSAERPRRRDLEPGSAVRKVSAS